MYKEVLRSIDGIGIYPVISLAIFLVFFSILLYWFFKVDKRYLKKMESIPLQNDEIVNSNITGKNYE